MIAQNVQHCFRAGGMLLGVTALVWIVLGGAEWLQIPKSANLPDRLTLFLTGDVDALTVAERVTVPLMDEPAYVYEHEVGTLDRAVYRYDFDVGDVARDRGLLLGWRRGILEIRLNQSVIEPYTETESWGMVGGFDPAVFVLPREYLSAGMNTLTFVCAGQTRKILPTVYVGSLEDVQSAFAWGRLFSVDFVVASIAVMGFLVVLSLIVRWPKQQQVGVYALVILLVLWSLRNLQFFQADAFLSAELQRPLHFIVACWFTLAFVGVTVVYTGLSRKYVLWTLIAAAAVALVIGSQYLIWHWRDAWHLSFAIETGLALVTAVGVSLRLAWYWGKTRHNGLIAAVILACVLVVSIDAADDRFAIHVPFVPELPLTFYAAPMTGLLAAVVMLAILVRQLALAGASQVMINQSLNVALAEREQDLAAEYALRQQAEKAAVRLEERRRILKDMHDGLGSRLNGLAFEAKDPTVSRDALADKIGQGLLELRLIVDAMDTEGDSIATAMGAFRERIEPILRSAGIDLEWDVHLTEQCRRSEDVLDLFRILQEACRNVVEHSHATSLCIMLTETDGDLHLTIQDNGRGLGRRKAGKGLSNMRERARRLGCELGITSNARGTLVELLVPRAEAVSADEVSTGTQPQPR